MLVITDKRYIHKGTCLFMYLSRGGNADRHQLPIRALFQFQHFMQFINDECNIAFTHF